MRLSLLILLATAACPACVEARPFRWPWSRQVQVQQQEQPAKSESRFFRWPWNSRATEQSRLNAAMAPKPTTREEQILRPDLTKEFNPGSANFGSGRSVTGKAAAAGTFHFVDKTRTKSFDTKSLATKEAWGAQSKFATKAAPSKESWFARLTAPTKTYSTRSSTDANKGLQGGAPTDANQKFLARGRRQAELDADRAQGRAPKLPFSSDRDGGQSWNGDLKPLTIQDVKSLLNKN